MRTALLLIDIQNEYFEGGNMELYHPVEALRKAKLLLEYFREKGLMVIHVQHVNVSEDAKAFRPNTEGIVIHKEITPIPGEKVIVKHRANSFFETTLQEELTLRGIQHMVVCGMMTHMCIDTTVRAAQDYNYKITLIKDACTTKDLFLGDKRVEASVVQETFLAALNSFSVEYNAEEYLRDCQYESLI